MKKSVAVVLCFVIIWGVTPNLSAQSNLHATYQWDYTTQWDPSAWGTYWDGHDGRYSEMVFTMVNPSHPTATVYTHSYMWIGLIGTLGDFDAYEYDDVSIYDSATGRSYWPRDGVGTWHEFRVGDVDANGVAHDQDVVTWDTVSNSAPTIHTNYINLDANYRDYLTTLGPQAFFNTVLNCPTCGYYAKVESPAKGWLARLMDALFPTAQAQGPNAWFTFAGQCGAYAVAVCAFFDDVAIWLPYGAAAAAACVATATAACIGTILGGGNIPGIVWEYA